MSDSCEPDGAAPLEPVQFGVLMETLQRLAGRFSNQAGIPQEKEDLVQHAFVQLLADGALNGRLPDEDSIAGIMTKRAARIVKRRNTERSNQGWAADDPCATASDPAGLSQARRRTHAADLRQRRVGIPRPCRRLVRLARGTKYEQQMERLVLAASINISRRPTVLDDRHFRAFSLAYLHGSPIEDIAASLRTTDRGATETLRRALSNVNEILIAEVSSRVERSVPARIPDADAVELTEKNRSLVTPDGKRDLAQVLVALGEVIHRIPWSFGPNW